MANLTVAIDDDLLHRARLRAVSQRTSVNAVVRRLLEAYAGAEEREQAWQRLVQLSETTSSGSGPGGRRWTRDELHER